MEIISEIRKRENIVVAEVAVSVKELYATADEVYLRKRENYKIFGFRKGRAPRRIIEERYGRNIFIKEAVQVAGRRAADAATDILGIRTIGRPGIKFGGRFGKKAVIFRIQYFLRPEVEISGYKGLKVDSAEAASESAEQKGWDLDDIIAAKLAGMVKAEIPQIVYERRVADMLREWMFRNREVGITLRDYCAYTNQTEAAFRESFRKPAEIQVKFRLALEEIAKLEGITVTVAEIHAYYQELAELHKMDVDSVRAACLPKHAEADVTVRKAFEWVKAHAEVS